MMAVKKRSTIANLGLMLALRHLDVGSEYSRLQPPDSTGDHDAGQRGDTHRHT